MPKRESKIMSMLENKGVIRKVTTDNERSVAGNDDVNPIYSPNIKTLIDTPERTVKSAARQPIPGMSTSVRSEDVVSASNVEYEYKPTVDSAPVFEQNTESAAAPLPAPVVETPPIAEPLPQPQPAYVEPVAPVPAFSGLDAFSEPAPVAEPSVSAVSARPDNYTDRYLNIDELYDALSLRSKKTDTIYLVEEYLQTLPDSLPNSTRRDIVGKLLSASDFDYDLLMGDGVLRVKMLKEYAERFASHTDDYIAARQAEVDEYEQNITRTRQLMDSRKELHKKQFYTIEAEAQRLKEILTFISG